MKPCDRVDSLLSAYLDHEASPAETRLVQDHLETCRRCSANVREVAALLPKLSRLPRVRVSDGFTARVLAEVKGSPVPDFDEPSVPRLRPRVAAWGFPLAAAAALALVTVSLVRVWVGPSSDISLAERTATSTATSLERALEHGGAAAKGTPVSATAPPDVATLPEVLPGLNGQPAEEAKSLGMARDAYAIDDWVLREPAEGGSPVLTRVGSDPSATVVVTF
jgi:anti-sigma factor RsiW